MQKKIQITFNFTYTYVFTVSLKKLLSDRNFFKISASHLCLRFQIYAFDFNKKFLICTT